jgi:hypothetical protein
MQQNPARTRGAVCLANDAVIEWFSGFCESFHRHNPGLPLTVIPFDENIAETRAVLTRYGYEMFTGESLSEMDALGAEYWPGETFKPHIMRKFCAWETYDTFLFLDADIVVLRPLDEYFSAFEASEAEFMYFETDIEQVYRPGQLREQMMSQHATAGFNSGAYMGNFGTLTTTSLRHLAAAAQPIRGGFVDNLEQSFINYCVDATGMRKVDANELLDSLVVAGALMRLERSGDAYVLQDRRVPESGRVVSMVHWAGYGLSPFMPYRRLYLEYRMPASRRSERLRHELAATAQLVRGGSARAAYHLVRRWPYRMRGWLSARGLAEWHGSQT